jgi:hypothetical protein
LHEAYVMAFELSRERLTVLEGRFAVATFLKACELQAPCFASEASGGLYDVQLRDLLLLPVRRIAQYTAILKALPDRQQDKELMASLKYITASADKIHADTYKIERRTRVLSAYYQFSDSLASAAAGRVVVKDGK